MNAVDVHPNILKPYLRQEHRADVAGWSMAEVAREFKPREWGSVALRGAINGRGFPEREFPDVKVGPGDHVILSQDILGIGAAIGLPLLLAVLLDVGLSVGLSYGVGIAIQHLQGRPRRPRTLSDQDSTTYRLAGGIATSYGSGLKIGLPYGKLRVGGQVLSQYLHEIGTRDDIYSVLLALGRGPIAQIAGIAVDVRQEHNRLGSLYGQQFGIQQIPSGIRINRVAISSQDSSVALRAGTFHQSPIGGNFHRGTTLSNVDKPLRSGVLQTFPVAPTTRRGRVRIIFDACFTATAGAAITTKAVAFEIRYLNASGQAMGNQIFTVFEAQRNPFAYSQLTREFNTPASGLMGVASLVLIRTSLDDDLTSSSSCRWANLVEEFESVELAYPGIALLALDVRASEQINGSVSDITAPIWGRLLRWRDGGVWQDPTFFDIPSGRWIGRNPAWVACDFLTSRYGLGLFVSDSMLNLQELQDWGEFCDETVDDGHAGLQPQFHCDLMIDQSRKAMDWLFDICRTGRAFPWWFGDHISFKFQRPTTSVTFPNPLRMIIAESNCPDLTIEATEIKHRPTIFDAQIANEEKDLEIDPVTVTDPGATHINEPWRLGYEPPLRSNRDLPGIVRPQQAKRDLVYEHATNRLRTWIASGTTGIDAFAIEPGDLFGIQQDFPRWFGTDTGGFRTSRANSGAAIYLDHEVTLAPATTYEVLLTDDDGVPQLVQVAAAPGTYAPDTAIAIASSHDTRKAAVVAFGIENKVTRTFQMLDFDVTEDLKVRWRALIWDDAVFSQPTPTANDELDTESPFMVEGSANVAASVSATPVIGGGGSFVVSWRHADINRRRARVYIRAGNRPAIDTGGILTDPWNEQGWARVYEGEDNQVTLERLAPFVEHEVSVTLTDRDGRWGSPSDSVFTVTPEEFPPLPPGSITGLRADPLDQGIRLSWTPLAPTGIKGYEVRAGPIWCGATVLGQTTDPWLELPAAPAEDSQTYLVAAIAPCGLYSSFIAEVTVAAPAPVEYDAMEDELVDLDPTDGGTHDGTELDADGTVVLSAGRVAGIYEMDELDLVTAAVRFWSLRWDCWGEDIAGFEDPPQGSGDSHWMREQGREATAAKPGVDFDVRLDPDSDEDSYLAGPFGCHGAHFRVVAQWAFDAGAGYGDWEPVRNGARYAQKVKVRFLLDRESASIYQVHLQPNLRLAGYRRTMLPADLGAVA